MRPRQKNYFKFLKNPRVLATAALLVTLEASQSGVSTINITNSLREPIVLNDFQMCMIEINKLLREEFPESKLNGEIITRECLDARINPVFVLAQGVIESRLGTMGASTKTNNVWNVGHFDNMSSTDMMKTTWHYDDPNKSLRPYLRLLREKYLGSNKTENSLMLSYVSLGGYRYASNPNYEKDLRTEFERLNRKYKNLKFICFIINRYKNSINNLMLPTVIYTNYDITRG